MIVLALIVLIAVVVFYIILQLDISGIWQFWLAFIEMVIVSQLLIRRYKLPSELGLILLKSKKGIRLIDRLAHNEKLWKFFSDAGNAMAYGLSSRILMKKNMRWDTLIVGLLTLGVIWRFVVPTAMLFLAQMLGTTMDSRLTDSGADLSSVPVIIEVALLLGGLFLVLVLSVIAYAAIVVFDFVSNILGSGAITSTVEPGGTLLLPGVNLPFFEGIAALIVILIVHEGAHAILSRVGKIPVLSSGIVLFGIIPVGAFVEPDEKQLAKLEPVKQTRVLIAGSTSNLFFSFVFFMLFIGTYLAIDTFSLMDSAIAPVARFIYITLGLTFSLNFVVGTVNLLPMPFFDGYRVLEANIKNKNIVKAIMIITLVAFLLNFLPWLFA